MSRYNSKKLLSKRDAYLRLLLAAVCLALIVVALPRGGGQTYSAREGLPWYGRELVAPFEFPLLKSDRQLQLEQDSVRRSFSPYFKTNAEVKVVMLTEWRKEASRLTRDRLLTSELAAQIDRRLQEVYDRGVISAAEFDSKVAGIGSQSISVISGKTFDVRYTDEIYTPKTAYHYIISDVPETVNKQMNLAAYIQANLVYDRKRTDEALAERLEDVLPTSGLVMKGTRIVDRGEIVTPEIVHAINSLNSEMERRNSTIVTDYYALLGQVIYVMLVLMGFASYLLLFRSDYVTSMRHVCLLAMLVTVMPVVTALAVRLSLFNVYVLPFAVVPIVARVFTDSRTATMTLTASVLLCAMPLTQPFQFIVVQLVCGSVAIYSLRELSERSQLFRCALQVTLAALAARLAVDMMDEWASTLVGLLYYASILICGVLLLFTYPLLFMIERLFGFTSNVTLVELSNINTVLLRRLSEEAPATFQHAMQVANLSAEVANAIGAKPQLVRTGALYHDIGKLHHPAFFTENQQGGVNPHDRLTPTQSARVIIGHVTTGLELAAEYNLPKVIREFISTHHGTSKAGYFYAKEREAHPGEEVDAAPFTYPGPNPTTAEQAILMMCDAVEAASRSLSEYNDESISGLVNRIVDSQVASGAFALCPVTFRDIDVAKRVLKEKLPTIYTTRLSYPDTIQVAPAPSTNENA